MSYKSYVVETIAYGFAGLVGLIGLFYFMHLMNWGLVVLVLIFTYIAFDNFFCGSRLTKHSGKICKQHYIIPPFLRNR